MIPSLNPYLSFPEDEKAPHRRQPFEITEQLREDNITKDSPSSCGLFQQSASSPERNGNKAMSCRPMHNHNDPLVPSSSSSTKLALLQQQLSSHSISAADHTNTNNIVIKTNAKQGNYYPPSLVPSSPPTQHKLQQLSHRPYKGFSTPFCGLFAASASSVSHPSQFHNHQQHHHCNAATIVNATSPTKNNNIIDKIELDGHDDDDDTNINNHALSSSHPQQYSYHTTKQSELQRAHRRTDLCSLTCFGVLQSDYTRYLFTHTRPPTLWKRMCLHLLTPLSLFILAGWCSGNIRNEYANSVVCTALVYCLFLWIATACCRGRKKRVMVRDEILWRLKRRDDTLLKELGGGEGRKSGMRATTTTKTTRAVKKGKKIGKLYQKTRKDSSAAAAAEESDDDDDYDDEEEYDYYQSGCAPPSILGQSRREMHCAHRMIGCYPSDIPRENVADSPYSYSVTSSLSPSSMRIRRMDGNGETSIISSPPMARECDIDSYVLQPDNEHNGTTNTTTDNTDGDDLCAKVWRTCCARPILPCLPCCCCNNNDINSRSYGFHLQFCGLCALAQEAREANIALPRHLRMMDYITMEPFLLYYPRILELRSSVTSSFWEHCRALSELSKLLLVSFKAILLAVLIISLSDAVKNWNLADMAVLVTTFLQSFVVMYCVHWGWHRFDLSIDAVIKYFACGFVLCTSMAFAVEFLGLFVFKLTTLIVVGLLDVQEVQDNGYGSSSSSRSSDGMQLTMDDSGYHRYLNMIYGLENDDQALTHPRFMAAIDDILEGFFDRQPFAKILYILISSYLMAGLVEELCKYFGFFMVDHPDFCSEKELEKSNATLQLQLRRDHSGDEIEEDEAAVNVEHSNAKVTEEPSATAKHTTSATEIPSANITFRPEMQRRSLSSIRSGVTVAMVAVALGFACCENVFHIFIYNRSSVKSEVATLIVKSLFPIHPIAAAIQSIYVCRRDLEGDASIGLGQTLFPSIVLRGTYEFAHLMIGWSSQRGYNNFYQEEHVTGIALLSFCVSLFLVVGGGFFYRRCSQAQYARLREESEMGDNSVSETSFGLMV